MPYREIHIGKETFITRVSDEAIKDWLGKREHLRNRGYPDRPPDVDTPPKFKGCNLICLSNCFNTFGKKLKEVSSINHHNNIEETALLNDLQLHEKKPKAPISHLKKPSSQRLKNTSDT